MLGKYRVVPYIGTWIETKMPLKISIGNVVPYIGTWIETLLVDETTNDCWVVPYIGTWIETYITRDFELRKGRTLYRYVD